MKQIKLKEMVQEPTNIPVQPEMKEDDAFIKNYLPNAIKDFVAKCDTNSSYKPQIKLHWGGDNNSEANTKWLAVTWDMIAKLIDATQGK